MSPDTLPIPSNHAENLIEEFKNSMRNDPTSVPINETLQNTEKPNKYSLKNLTEEDIKRLLEIIEQL